MKVELNTFNNAEYRPGSVFKRGAWYIINNIFFRPQILPFYGLKRFLLRSFGAKLGRKVLIKPGVNIKYPWFLQIGDYTWIGENVWIDNLANIAIGKNVCISQGAFLLTGNHDYSKAAFDLVTKEIILEDGVWIGAKAIVCPGITCGTHSILSVGSVAQSNLDAYGIYQGNPAQKKRERVIIK